ncbi:MAG: hypothetical protein AAFZ11_06535 [Pseudomonadota bacterium]
MTTLNPYFAPIALGLSAMVAVPAAAAESEAATGWDKAATFQVELEELEREVNLSGRISRVEERVLEDRIDTLEARYERYAEDGLTEKEIKRLEGDLEDLERDVDARIRDRDLRRF